MWFKYLCVWVRKHEEKKGKMYPVFPVAIRHRHDGGLIAVGLENGSGSRDECACLQSPSRRSRRRRRPPSDETQHLYATKSSALALVLYQSRKFLSGSTTSSLF